MKKKAREWCIEHNAVAFGGGCCCAKNPCDMPNFKMCKKFVHKKGKKVKK